MSLKKSKSNTMVLGGNSNDETMELLRKAKEEGLTNEKTDDEISKEKIESEEQKEFKMENTEKETTTEETTTKTSSQNNCNKPGIDWGQVAITAGITAVSVGVGVGVGYAIWGRNDSSVIPTSIV